MGLRNTEVDLAVRERGPMRYVSWEANFPLSQNLILMLVILSQVHSCIPPEDLWKILPELNLTYWPWVPEETQLQ